MFTLKLSFYTLHVALILKVFLLSQAKHILDNQEKLKSIWRVDKESFRNEIKELRNIKPHSPRLCEALCCSVPWSISLQPHACANTFPEYVSASFHAPLLFLWVQSCSLTRQTWKRDSFGRVDCWLSLMPKRLEANMKAEQSPSSCITHTKPGAERLSGCFGMKFYQAVISHCEDFRLILGWCVELGPYLHVSDC